MFVTDNIVEIKKKLADCFKDQLVTEEIVADLIDIRVETLKRFLAGKPIRKTTLLKIAIFLEEYKPKREESVKQKLQASPVTVEGVSF